MVDHDSLDPIELETPLKPVPASVKNRDSSDTIEPETSPKPVPVSAKNHDDAAEALDQSNEGENVGDAFQGESDPTAKDASGKKIGENHVKKEYENDTESLQNSRRRKEGHSRPKKQNNNKFDPSVKGISSNAEGIRNLVAFYFSDSNLASDRHLGGLVAGTTNRPVRIDHIHTFKRLKQYQPYSAVVAALKESDVFEVTGSEGSEEIKRKRPFDPIKAAESDSRTIYAKGFGEETATTQFEVEDFFAPFGPINSVRLRRTDGDWTFKGSCFIEFQNQETFQKFLDLDPKPLWQGKHELKIMSKFAYTAEKNELIRDGKVNPKASNHSRGRGRRGRGNDFRGGGGRHDHGDRDPDDWKRRREDDQKSGFRDNRNGRDNRNRSGHGRGWGTDKHGCNNDRNQERRDPWKDLKLETDDKVEKGAHDADAEPERIEMSKKRERDDDTETEGAPAKKVDSKEVSETL